jgi:hypothetical protein
MAADAVREKDADEWTNALIGDVADEAWWSLVGKLWASIRQWNS